jgi:hypothetical protein
VTLNILQKVYTIIAKEIAISMAIVKIVRTPMFFMGNRVPMKPVVAASMPALGTYGLKR